MTAPAVDPLKQDFRNFLFMVWQHLNLPTPTPVQYDIARFLQQGPKRRIVEAFRGIGKSWITAAYVLWLLYCNPEERILVVSASKVRADAFSVFVKRLIAEMPLLHHLKPREGQRDSNIAFDVGPSSAHQAPSVRSVGITGQLTGGRATHIIADDVEVPGNSLTQTMRDKLSEAVKEFDAVLVPGGVITYLGTPQTEMSLYNELPKRGYVMRVWPARFPNAALQARYGDRLAPFITKALEKNPALATACSNRGAPVEPNRFHDLDLFEREASYGRSGFAMQFMLDTSFSDMDKYPLKIADLMVLNLSVDIAPVKLAWASGPEQLVRDLHSVGMAGDQWYRPLFVAKEFTEYQGCVMTIDPSGRGSDETGYAVVAMLNGYLYVLAAGGFKGGYEDDTLQSLADMAKKYKVKQVIIESNFGDGMFTKLLTPFLVRTYPVTTEEVRSNQQKEKRIIDVLEPVMNQHRLVIDESVIQRDLQNYNEYADEKKHLYQLFYQLSRVTRERGALAKDDRLDALAMAVAYWVEQMDKDTQKVLDDHRSEMLRLELQKFSEHVFGMSQAGENWADSW
jgi:hypothetical protein